MVSNPLPVSEWTSCAAADRCNNGTVKNGKKIVGELKQPIPSSCHIAMVINCPSVYAVNSSLHMKETSDSSGSGSCKASLVTVAKLAFERVSMAECIMGSHTSSMFGITNIFCGRTSALSKAAE